jgi:hypothetical protein
MKIGDTSRNGTSKVCADASRHFPSGGSNQAKNMASYLEYNPRSLSPQKCVEKVSMYANVSVNNSHQS